MEMVEMEDKKKEITEMEKEEKELDEFRRMIDSVVDAMKERELYEKVFAKKENKNMEATMIARIDKDNLVLTIGIPLSLLKKYLGLAGGQ